MIYKKNKKDYQNQNASLETYIFFLLIFSYLLGVCLGCYFVFSNKENIVFISYIVSKGSFDIIVYFILTLIFKYSGVLSSLVCFLPTVMGLQNSIFYCNTIISKNSNVFKDVIMASIKDTSLVLLLVIYITIVIYQIIEKKYNIKKDIQYFSAYTIGAVSVLALSYALKILFKNAVNF